jgi:hypothetical protein
MASGLRLLLLDSQVQLMGADAEPDASADSQSRRFRDLFHPEHAAVELACGRLGASRDRDLDMVQAKVIGLVAHLVARRHG